MRVLSLFAGIGGMDLGLERAGMTVVAQCEIDPFCRQVLRKHWPKVKQYDDVRTLSGEQVKREVGPVDVCVGGYPCQPFSTAGKRGGAEDDRHLWPEMRRLVEALRPAWVVGENVAGHITLGLDQVLSDLDTLGYASRAFVIPAVAVDAKHRRDRVWIVAHANSSRQCAGTVDAEMEGAPGTSGQVVANANSQGLEGRECGELRERGTKRTTGQGCASVRDASPAIVNRPIEHEDETGGTRLADPGWWPSDAGVCRVAHGVRNRVDRIRSLGNSIVPQVAEEIGRAIMRVQHD